MEFSALTYVPGVQYPQIRTPSRRRSRTLRHKDRTAETRIRDGWPGPRTANQRHLPTAASCARLSHPELRGYACCNANKVVRPPRFAPRRRRWRRGMWCSGGGRVAWAAHVGRKNEVGRCSVDRFLPPRVPCPPSRFQLDTTSVRIAPPDVLGLRPSEPSPSDLRPVSFPKFLPFCCRALARHGGPRPWTV